jgi:CheY-like chemotaxis protein/HPt (histidine-containing phosphotransfer) domain-containing protein
LEAVSHDDDLGLPPGLREEYLEGARDQLGGIAELAERLVAAGDDVEALDELRREAHKIRGSAGSFGFAQATAVAAELEEAAKERRLTGVAARGFVRRLAAALFTKQPHPLPLPSPPATPTDDAPRTPPAAPEVPPDTTQVPEVIVVEDDAALAELLTFGLEARGYRFVRYGNGREALAALREMNTQGTTPLLLLDVDLPALDGYSIFDILARECPGKFRVVFTTVHGSETEQLRGLEAGAIDYMVKPMSLRVALEKIRRWVGR